MKKNTCLCHYSHCILRLLKERVEKKEWKEKNKRTCFWILLRRSKKPFWWITLDWELKDILLLKGLSTTWIGVTKIPVSH